MNILQTIIKHKKEEIALRKQKIKRSILIEQEFYSRRSPSLRKAIEESKQFAIIAEIKRASPSSGSFNQNIIAKKIAYQFQLYGATAISVLTDEKFFSGSLDDLYEVRKEIHLPLLRKDFIIDEYQLYEAKAYGADAILLIAQILDRLQLADLHQAANEIGLDPLVELYDIREIDILDFEIMNFIGLNNRNLDTFQVDLNRSLTMAQYIPKGTTVVSESGIQSLNDLKKLQQGGIMGALIGEFFMKSEDPGKTLQTLVIGMKNETES